MYTSFEAYITPQNVARLLTKEIGKYIGLKKQYHPAHYAQLCQLLPPISYWGLLPKDKRGDKQAKRQAMQRLQHIITRHLNGQTTYPYMQRLMRFVSNLKDIARDPNTYSFPSLFIKANIKETDNDGTIVCRPVSTYRDLTAKILTTLMASYIKSWLDPLLHDNNMAYRAARTWLDQPNVVTSNINAVDLLMRYRQQHNHQPIYIAECDISKFFDTVDHRVVISAMKTTLRRAGRETDSSFLTLFERFIHSFNFKRDVYNLNNDQRYWRTIFGPEADNHTYRFAWVHPIPSEPVGIPQGVALSPIITNMLLNIIDEQLLQDRMTNGSITDPQLLYVRYCDDILIAHTDQQVCRQLLSSYCNILNEYRFTYHPVKSVSDMKDGALLLRDDNGKIPFWSAKSKNVYLWGEGSQNASRWIGFLGYEISREGHIRLRKSSVQIQAERIYKSARKIECSTTYQQQRLQRFEDQPIGGSKIDAISSIESAAEYEAQIAKLSQLKSRKIRKLRQTLL